MNQTMTENKPRKKNGIVMQKTEDLINSVQVLSSNIPEFELLDISDRLIGCVGTVPVNLEHGYNVDQNVSKIKFLIKVFQALAECKNYLKLIQRLNYCDTSELMGKVDDLKSLILTEFPSQITLNKSFDESYLLNG